MYFIFICHHYGYIHMIQISSKNEAKGIVVEDQIYYQAGISEDSQSHLQDRERLMYWG
jgi:hypothetical protein